MASSALAEHSGSCMQYPEAAASDFREALRHVPSCVALVTTRDRCGEAEGMAASAIVPVSMEPPSVLVAVNRAAGIHSTLKHSGRLCINFLAQSQADLLRPFSCTNLRAERFLTGDWNDLSVDDPAQLPWLSDARAVIFGEVDKTIGYGTHTLFIARVDKVLLPKCSDAQHPPLVWLGGHSASLLFASA